MMKSSSCMIDLRSDVSVLSYERAWEADAFDRRSNGRRLMSLHDPFGTSRPQLLVSSLVPAPTKAYILVMAHVHHSHSGPDLASAAQTTMERSGEQWTPMRA